MKVIGVEDASLRLRDASRIMVVGCSGSGKSTLSQALSKWCSLEYISMDRDFFWLPGWENRGNDEIGRLVAEAVQKPRWIIDGTHPRTMADRLLRAELVLWPRPPRYVSVRGVVTRWFRYAGKTRPEMAEGCPERLDWDFLRYVWTFEQKMAPRVETEINTYAPEMPVCVLKSYRETDHLLALLCRDH